MKKREITNINIEQMFANIVEQEPLLTENQINSFLNNLPKPRYENAVKSFFKFHFNTFLLIASIVLIIASVLIWLNSDKQSEEVTVQSNPEKKVVAPVTAYTITPEPAIIINKEIGQNKAYEDTVIIDFDTNASTAIAQTETAISLSDVYKHFEKKPQVFSIRTDRDTTIICKEGTTIKIDANSLISEKTGNPISGTFQLKVKEYYKISDMILANLTTTSGGKIIETGGMLHISASNNSENCIIKPGCDIKIGFPYSGKKDDMALFYGDITNDKIDWKLANKTDDVIIQISPEAESNSEVFFIVEDMPEFPGGELAMRRFLIENSGYPSSMLNKKIEGKVMVTFVVDSDGNTTNIRVVKGLDETLDKVAVYVVSKFPKWKPGRQRGKPIDVSYTIPVVFSAKEEELTKIEIDKAKELEEKLKSFKYDNESAKYLSNSDKFKKLEEEIRNENYNETSVFEVNRYLFSTTQLGWLNCDRFLNENKKLTDLFILNENSDNTIVNVIFHRFKSLVPGNIESEKIVFRNIPEGEKVTIVAIKSIDNKIFLAIKETLATNNGEIKLDFQQVTFDLLKNEIEKLNKYY